jgi:hypothetical protein
MLQLPVKLYPSDKMTRTSHKEHPTLGYPVYCLDWVTDDTLILGGGGGASRSGIDNKLVRCGQEAGHPWKVQADPLRNCAACRKMGGTYDTYTSSSSATRRTRQ